MTLAANGDAVPPRRTATHTQTSPPPQKQVQFHHVPGIYLGHVKSGDSSSGAKHGPTVARDLDAVKKPSLPSPNPRGGGWPRLPSQAAYRAPIRRSIQNLRPLSPYCCCCCCYSLRCYHCWRCCWHCCCWRRRCWCYRVAATAA